MYILPKINAEPGQQRTLLIPPSTEYPAQHSTTGRVARTWRETLFCGTGMQGWPKADGVKWALGKYLGTTDSLLSS